MKTLDQIATEHGTDKASTHPQIAGHNYAVRYDEVFSPFRHEQIKLLEIGVGGAESIKTWLEYFPKASIVGVDIVKDTNIWNTPGSSPDPRYTFCQGDQGDETFWKCFAATYGANWNVIIDDGSHFSKDIIVTFNQMWQHMASKGLYCIEDLAVAYGAGSIFCPAGWQNHMDFVKDKLEDINLNGSVDSLMFSKELAILRKP